MSFLAKLFINDRIINVLHINSHMSQAYDSSTLKPSARTNGGQFTLVMEATSHTDFLNTLLSGSMCNGYIRFFKRDGMSKLNDYEFFDAYISNITTNYSMNSQSPMTDTITFSPGILRVGNVVLEKWWKITDLNREELVAEQTEEESDLVLEEMYFEDEAGNKTTDLETGKVYLIIKTKNGDGKTLDVDLEDKKHDFKYNGKILENDLLEGIRIVGNRAKIALEVIDEQNNS